MTPSSPHSLELSAGKRALLEDLLAADGMTAPVSRGIPRRAPGDSSPLSFAQQRLWFLDEFAPGNPFYNLATAVRLSGPLSLEALEGAFDEVVRRHEVLRTRLVSVDGQPRQVVGPPEPMKLEPTDVPG